MNFFPFSSIYIAGIDSNPKCWEQALDKDKFEKLFLQCRNALDRFVRWRISNPASAEDLLQDTVLLAFRRRDTLKNVDSFKPWLLQIARNLCNEYYRRHGLPPDLPLDDGMAGAASQSSERNLLVHDVLGSLPKSSGEVLKLMYFDDLTQAEIAQILDIPLGTVKSRLNTAKRQFHEAYEPKGALTMSELPKIMPEYTITASDKPSFSVRWEEIMGWFAVPKLEEKISWAIYDKPSRDRKECYQLETIGRAAVHGIEGVEIIARETLPDGTHGVDRTFVAQLTDTHCRILSESHISKGVRRLYTFLDGDEFLMNWGFGLDNCGNNVIPVTDGHFTVVIGGKTYDTVRVTDIEGYNEGMLSETYLDRNGRTVLWRRFNRDDWHNDRYAKPWSELLPNNERLTINGAAYIHWYDCLTDYVF
jgi:RNA polymerase sigma factor (sigma-70 family)